MCGSVVNSCLACSVPWVWAPTLQKQTNKNDLEFHFITSTKQGNSLKNLIAAYDFFRLLFYLYQNISTNTHM